MLSNENASQNKVVDLLKRDEEIFHSFGVSPNGRFLVVQSILLQNEEQKVEKAKPKGKKKG